MEAERLVLRLCVADADRDRLAAIGARRLDSAVGCQGGAHAERIPRAVGVPPAAAGFDPIGGRYRRERKRHSDLTGDRVDDEGVRLVEPLPAGAHVVRVGTDRHCGLGGRGRTSKLDEEPVRPIAELHVILPHAVILHRKLGAMRKVRGDGIELAVLDEGQGPAVLLLHGFPDSSYLWRHQVPALVGAGLRVIAPDLRGFGESDKPEDVEAYRLHHSVADVVAVLDALGVERAHVVGHDWGAGLAWAVAAFVPDRVERLVAMSVGHPAAQREPTIEQRQKAWYMLLFQFEGIAEELLQRDDWRLFREWTRGHGDLDRSLADLSRPGALTAGLNWYRANVHPARELGHRREFPVVAAPTLGIWSSGDDFLVEGPLLRSAEHVTGPWRYERIEGASHWLQLDAPERVNGLLLDHLG
jgi:pimeloyl-ACP methyl ester carboxylesterase